MVKHRDIAGNTEEEEEEKEDSFRKYQLNS